MAPDGEARRGEGGWRPKPAIPFSHVRLPSAFHGASCKASNHCCNSRLRKCFSFLRTSTCALQPRSSALLWLLNACSVYAVDICSLVHHKRSCYSCMGSGYFYTTFLSATNMILFGSCYVRVYEICPVSLCSPRGNDSRERLSSQHGSKAYFLAWFMNKCSDNAREAREAEDTQAQRHKHYCVLWLTVYC